MLRCTPTFTKQAREIYNSIKSPAKAEDFVDKLQEVDQNPATRRIYWTRDPKTGQSLEAQWLGEFEFTDGEAGVYAVSVVQGGERVYVLLSKESR